MRGDVMGARRFADESIAVASEFGFPTVLAGAKVLQGWSRAHSGELDDYVKIVREGVDEFERSTGRVWHATLNGILLDVLILSGRLEEATTLADESIEFANSFGERVSLAELWRAKGNICLASADHDQLKAEECFRRAIAIAREQGARLFELRASTNLASLLCETDRRGEARSILSEIYKAFTEGLETPDLKEAKALLNELGFVSKKEPRY
jgi:predicted ATPase